MVKKPSFLSYKDYYDFKCIGTNCKETCCQTSNWIVDIDDATLKRYEALPKSSNVMENIAPYADGIQGLKCEGTHCTFFDSNRLCSLYLNYGPEYMSETCHLFPRYLKLSGSNFKICLSLGCPVVSEKYLFSSEPIEIISYYEPDPHVSLASKNLSQNHEIVLFLFHAIHKIVQNTDHLLFEKLIHMSLMYRSLATHNNENFDLKDLTDLIAKYENNFTDKETLDHIRSSATVVDSKRINNLYSIIFSNMKEKILNGLTSENDELAGLLKNFEVQDVTAISDKLYMLRRRLVGKYNAKNPKVFANYLSMVAYGADFLLIKSDFDLTYKAFLTRFIMFQIFLAVLFMDKKELTDSDVLLAAYTFERRVLHSIDAAFGIVSFCEESKDLSVALLLSAIRE